MARAVSVRQGAFQRRREYCGRRLDFEDTLDDRAASLPKLIRKFLQA
jgi:hypothetical protein